MRKALKILGIMFIAFVGPTGWSMVTLAEDDAPTNTNPYMVIAERNVFRLLPPPPPETTNNAPEPEKPKVVLSGFATVAGVTTVFMSIPAKDAKDRPTYLRLKRGEAQDDIQLLDIREQLGEVDILDAGAQITLSVKSNSYAMTPMAPTPTKTASGAPMFVRPLPSRLNGPPNPGAPFMPAPLPLLQPLLRRLLTVAETSLLLAERAPIWPQTRRQEHSSPTTDRLQGVPLRGDVQSVDRGRTCLHPGNASSQALGPRHPAASLSSFDEDRLSPGHGVRNLHLQQLRHQGGPDQAGVRQILRRLEEYHVPFSFHTDATFLLNTDISQEHRLAQEIRES